MGSAEDGGGVALWAVLLFAFTLAGALAFVVAGLNPDDHPPRSSATLLLVPAGIVLTAYAPSLAALLVAARACGARALLRQVGRWRMGVGWYALVLIGPFVLALSADLIYVLSGGGAPETWLDFPASLAFVGPLVAGSLGEELGWRGFAQPRLQVAITPFERASSSGLSGAPGTCDPR
jgi:membrane protease YdiL (CAAX protease family)